MQEIFDLVVVGGGAAGFFGALAAAESDPSLRIIILERSPRPLAKVLISGGGRCNVTHACFDPAELVKYYPRGEKELRGPFTRFQPRDTVEWFESRGVPLKTEADGRIFPVSDRSQSIADCLLSEAERLGVKVWDRCPVRSITRSGAGFVVEGGGFGRLEARKVLLTPGGNAGTLSESAAGFGHTIVPPVPSLFTFNIRDERLLGLQGVSVDPCHLTLNAMDRQFEASGPVLITHWGLSGPAVLKLSAHAARELANTGYNATLTLNWLPEDNTETVFDALLQLKEAHPKSRLTTQNPFGKLPGRLWRSLVSAAGPEDDRTLAETGNKRLRSLAQQITAGQYTIKGKGVFKEEFVTCGGVALNEVNLKTMESRLQPGLFFAGEFLDIDGLTGGFNFQSAWTTGWLAGLAIAA